MAKARRIRKAAKAKGKRAKAKARKRNESFHLEILLYFFDIGSNKSVSEREERCSFLMSSSISCALWSLSFPRAKSEVCDDTIISLVFDLITIDRLSSLNDRLVLNSFIHADQRLRRHGDVIKRRRCSSMFSEVAIVEQIWSSNWLSM